MALCVAFDLPARDRIFYYYKWSRHKFKSSFMVLYPFHTQPRTFAIVTRLKNLLPPVFSDTLISTPWRLTKGLKKILVAADFKPIRLSFSLFANFLLGKPGKRVKIALLNSSLQIRIVCKCRTINPQLIVNYLSYFSRLRKCYFLLNIAVWETRKWEYAVRYKCKCSRNWEQGSWF